LNAVIAAAAYAEGRRVADIAIEDAGAWARKDGHFVWIGLYEPAEELLRCIQAQFGLHALAVEDALNAHQRPKLEVYGETLFVVLRTARLLDGQIGFGETHIFVGDGFVVSVRHGASASYGQPRAIAEASPDLLRHGEDYVLYAIMDFVTDNYLPILDALESETGSLEQTMLLRSPKSNDIERIYQLRRDLANLRRAAAPLQDVCLKLDRLDLPVIDAEVRPYYHDVHDHVIRINESIDTLREVLSFAFEAGMMTAAARQNDVTRKLAAWAAMLAVPTAIAGVYGMNFEHMPELKWEYGYYGILAVIAVLVVGLYTRFKKLGWL